jgi:nucleotide-binding universal stress UspA family protein
MKKIILAFDGSHFSEGAFEFIRKLNAIQPVFVTGVFIPQTSYSNLWSYAAAAGSGSVFVPLEDEAENDKVGRNIYYFEMLCKQYHIKHSVHKDAYEFALPALQKETRFADLLVVSGELFYKGVTEFSQMDYLSDILHNTECPVLIVPEEFDFPKTNILAYDGSNESVYAIKQFAYLFPELTKDKTLLVYAESDLHKDFPAKEFIFELAAHHYDDLTFYKLDLDPKKYFTSWIGSKKASVLVSGSFSRSSLSQLFRKSFVTNVIKQHKIPVFIAHK